MPKYRVVHNNHYSFQETVRRCQLEARLRPPDSKDQTVEFSQFVVRPLADSQSTGRDAFGNCLNLFEICRPLQSLQLSAIHTVTTHPPRQVDFLASPPWEQIADIQAIDEILKPYLGSPDRNTYTAYHLPLNEYAKASFAPGRPLLDAAFDLMQRIHHDFTYDPHATSVQTTAIESFEFKRGVCQDFTHVAIACLQSLELPVRYVSGYVDTQADSAQYWQRQDVSHAWFSVYEPEQGWIDFDPTNNLLPGEKHIDVAYGGNYQDIAPLVGHVDIKGENKLSVSVRFEEID